MRERLSVTEPGSNTTASGLHGVPLPGRRGQDLSASRTLFPLILLPPALALVILIALVVRAWPILHTHPLRELLAGTVWKPPGGSFGFQPFIAGTVWVTVTAAVLAVPPCPLTASYPNEQFINLLGYK